MRFRKPAAIAAIAVAAVLTLSGCVRMQADVYINSDAQIDKIGGTIALNKAALQTLAGMGGGTGEIPTNVDEFKALMLEQNSDSQQDIEENCSFSETEVEFVMTCEGTAGEELGNQSGLGGLADQAMLTKEGNTISAVLQTENAQDQMGLGDVDPLLGGTDPSTMFQTTLAMHFPGPVESVTGTGAAISATDPNVVVIDLMKTNGEPVTIKASAGSANFLPILLGGVVLLAVIGGLGFLLLGRRNKPAPSQPLLTQEDLNKPTDGDNSTL